MHSSATLRCTSNVAFLHPTQPHRRNARFLVKAQKDTLAPKEQQSLQSVLSTVGLSSSPWDPQQMPDRVTEHILNTIKKGVEKEVDDLVQLEGAILLAEQLYRAQSTKTPEKSLGSGSALSSTAFPQEVDVWQVSGTEPNVCIACCHLASNGTFQCNSRTMQQADCCGCNHQLPSTDTSCHIRCSLRAILHPCQCSGCLPNVVLPADVLQPVFASSGGFPRLLYIPVPEYFDMHRQVDQCIALFGELQRQQCGKWSRPLQMLLPPLARYFSQHQTRALLTRTSISCDDVFCSLISTCLSCS